MLKNNFDAHSSNSEKMATMTGILSQKDLKCQVSSAKVSRTDINHGKATN